MKTNTTWLLQREVPSAVSVSREAYWETKEEFKTEEEARYALMMAQNVEGNWPTRIVKQISTVLSEK